MHKVVQQPREFVICRPSGYHCGFNAGFNIAEAVNFALPRWLDIAKDGIGYCKCDQFNDISVSIDMDKFIRRLRGENVPDENIK